MLARGVTAADVLRVLRLGHVTHVEWKKDETWRVEGKDIDGRSIRIITVVRETELLIRLITVITP